MSAPEAVLPRPSLKGAAINASTERAALGYPEGYVPLRLESFEEDALALRAGSPASLARTAEDAREPLARRLAAGALLALVGDPRLNALAPALVDVPAARVMLGLDAGRVRDVAASLEDCGVLEDWIAKEAPAHEVAFSAYRLGKYPVTNVEYRAFLRATGYPELPTSWTFGRYPLERANHPVFTVSPAAADAYAAWLRLETGRPFRLPTEAEWEHAAAGPAGLDYPWGDEFLLDRANTVECGLLTSTPVGVFPAGRSPFGALDMAGNVEEYVADDYRPYAGAAAVDDDLRRTRGEYRVARGGSFTRYHDLARTRRRHGWYARSIYVMGFRIAEDA